MRVFGSPAHAVGYGLGEDTKKNKFSWGHVISSLLLMLDALSNFLFYYKTGLVFCRGRRERVVLPAPGLLTLLSLGFACGHNSGHLQGPYPDPSWGAQGANTAGQAGEGQRGAGQLMWHRATLSCVGASLRAASPFGGDVFHVIHKE